MSRQVDMKELQEEILSSLMGVCRTRLSFNSRLKLNALVAITLDENDIHVIDIRKTLHKEKYSSKPSGKATYSSRISK